MKSPGHCADPPKSARGLAHSRTLRVFDLPPKFVMASTGSTAMASELETPALILASASPRRSELLRQLRSDFEIIPAAVEEMHEEYMSAGELAQVNACRKARAVAKRFPEAVVIGVDTLVSAEGRIFGKPRTRAEARGTLAWLQGRTHQVTTGVCLIYWRGRRQRIFCEQTDVTFHRLTLAQIRGYHRLVDPLDKAGGYGIQEKGEMLVESISGSFSNVVGLPLEALRMELEAFWGGLGSKNSRLRKKRL
jgi:septum formation protein